MRDETIIGQDLSHGAPRVVGVHGIGQQYGSRPELTNAWWLAMRGGLEHAGRRAIADRMTNGGLTVAHFGALFRRAGTLVVSAPHLTAQDLKPGLETELLLALYAGGRRSSTEVGCALGFTSDALRKVILSVLATPAMAHVTESLLVGSVKQLTQFLTDAETRAQVLELVDQEVSGRAVVMVGHSLGSVVAYEYLTGVAPSSVTHLITLGSPLGAPNLVRDRLTVNADGTLWPPSVQTWDNFSDVNDLVALRPRLSSEFLSPDGVRFVRDHSVRNGSQPHSALRYLNSGSVGASLGEALGG